MRTLGANIGTTVTALLASMAATGENAEAGLVIAMVHFWFNVTGTLMIYPIRAIREIPLTLARRFADLAVRSRAWAVTYVIVLNMVAHRGRTDVQFLRRCRRFSCPARTAVGSNPRVE